MCRPHRLQSSEREYLSNISSHSVSHLSLTNVLTSILTTVLTTVLTRVFYFLIFTLVNPITVTAKPIFDVTSPITVREGPPSSDQIQLKSSLHPAQKQLEACADCHPDYVEGFKNTHMSRAMSKPLLSEVIENFSPEVSQVIHPKTGVGYRAFIDDQGRWWQEEFDPKGDYRRTVEVKYLIGSGNNTRSYIGEVQGELIELPLTWYSPTPNRLGLWDMSPGYQRRDHFRFTRPVKGDCLFCHNDLSKINNQRLSGFVGELPSGITCVRCHGDGQAHIEARLNGEVLDSNQGDLTIFNPKSLSPLRQHQLCEQCHLSGEARALLPGQSWDAYDPRTPLEDYFRVYAFPLDKNVHPELSATESFGIASHAERMKLSACATKSEVFTCTTCHDPHRPDTSTSYQKACLSCHQEGDHNSHHEAVTSCSKVTDSKTDQPLETSKTLCYQCHMKKSGTSDIPHVRMTDHWVRRSPDFSDQPEESETSKPDTVFSDQLVSLLPSLRLDNKQYKEGLLGLAYADLVRFNGRGEFASKALNLLVNAAKQHPQWPELWSRLAEMSEALGDHFAALSAYQQYASLMPNDEYYRLKEVALLIKVGELIKAENILKALIKVRASNYQAYEQLGNIYFQRGAHSEAETFYKTANKLAPEQHSLPHNLGFLSLLRGDFKAARKYFYEGIRRDGVSREGPFYLGLLEAAEKQYQKAIELIGRSLSRDPTYYIAYQQLARITYESGDPSGSIKVLQRWINQDPTQAEAYLILAQYLDAQGLYREVHLTLKRAMTFSSDPRLSEALEVSKKRLNALRGK